MDYTCPRCDQAVDEEYYGPCEQCRADLRATMHIDRREIEVEAYAPKMNVTPNAVAQKDD